MVSLNTARQGHSCVQQPETGNVIVAGGQQNERYLDSVEIYDVSSDHWNKGKHHIVLKYTDLVILCLKYGYHVQFLTLL